MAAVTTNAIGMSTYTKLGYNLERDLAPVALAGNVPHMLVVHPTLPAKNVKEVIALGKARPGELLFASQGPGTLSHLEQEMLKQMGGFTALHVPYKGSAPGLADLIPGNVQLFFDSIPSSLPHVKTGRHTRDRRRLEHALSGAARCACDQRVAEGFRGRQLVRDHGAGWNAARDYREAQCRDAEDPRDTGSEGPSALAGRRRGRRHAGAARRAPQGGYRQVGQGRARGEREGINDATPPSTT